MKVFIFDQAKCNGCYNCQIACKDEHVDNDWRPVAAPQPDTGHFWLKMSTIEHGQTPKIRVEYRAEMCNHCDEAPCIAAGGGAFYKRTDGLVVLDPALASDPALLDACPFGAVYWNQESKIAQKCSGCAHLVDEGKMPHCVDLCVIGAFRFGEEEEFAAEIAEAETYVDQAVGPRVYYLNCPKLFIGGEVWDEAADEIIEGAAITLTDAQGNTFKTTSDNFGDFWFNRLMPDEYELLIEADGYQSVSKSGIKLREALNLGDFALQK
jgi:Fe-S-cluster-containing dehydrogenase component